MLSILHQPHGYGTVTVVDAGSWQDAVSSSRMELGADAGSVPPVDGVAEPSFEGEGLASALPTRTVIEEETEWKPKHQRKFVSLLRGHSLGRLTSAQEQELDALQRLRRRVHYPRTAEEIMFEYRSRNLAKNLIAALHEYVSFFKLADKTRPGTGKKA